MNRTFRADGSGSFVSFGEFDVDDVDDADRDSRSAAVGADPSAGFDRLNRLKLRHMVLVLVAAVSCVVCFFGNNFMNGCR